MFASVRSTGVGWLLVGALTALMACTPAPKDGDDASQTAATTTGSGGGGGSDTMQQEVPLDPAAPFALIELFTSEGCSSCPPADNAVQTVLNNHTSPGERVFAIEWHVDYWDYLGHRDPYSSEIYTARQEAYARAANENQLFTPQLLVNTANTSPVSATIESGIGGALANPVTVSTTVWLDETYSGPGLVLNYKVLDAPADAQLHVVLVEGGIDNDVYAGENAGKTLHHAAAVRWYTAVPVGESAFLMQFADDVALANSSIVAFVQTEGDMALHGATRIAATAAP